MLVTVVISLVGDSPILLPFDVVLIGVLQVEAASYLSLSESQRHLCARVQKKGMHFYCCCSNGNFSLMDLTS